MASPRVRQILYEVLTDPVGQSGPAEQVLDRLCAATVAALPVDGAGLALMTTAGKLLQDPGPPPARRPDTARASHPCTS